MRTNADNAEDFVLLSIPPVSQSPAWQGFAAINPLAPPGPMAEESSITRAEFDELLEPLKHTQVPPCPGEEAFVCDGALYGFTALLGSTSFSYQWHTIPPAGWEPVAEWLGGAIHQLAQLTGTPFP